MQDIPPRGSIADIFFPRLIAALHRGQFEGAVRVGLGDTTKIIYFRRGEIASAASNADSDRLAAILIQEGRLTQPQFDMAKSRVAPGGSLGKTLIEIGFLTPSELLQGARRQVRQILSSCCTLPGGSYALEAGPLPPEVTVLGIPTRRLVFDCVLEATDRHLVLREIGSMESIYGPTVDLSSGLGALKLDIEVDQLGRLLDGRRTLRDLSSRTSLDDFTVSKAILALEILGLAEPVGVPSPRRSGAPGARTIPIESDQEQAPAEADVLDLGEGEQVPSAADEPAETVITFESTDEDAAVATDESPSQAATGTDREGPSLEPPVPAEEELPAFASPHDAQPRWQIDPETGERVHLGPIEVTFEGHVGAGRKETRNFRILLGGAGALTAVLALLFVHLGRRGAHPRDSAPEPPAPQVTRPLAAPEAATSAGTAEPLAAAPPLIVPAPPSGAAPSPAAPQAAAPRPQVTASQAPASLAAASQPGPSQAPAEAIDGPLPPAPHGSISPFRESSRYVTALHRLDSGDIAGASGIFQELADGERSGQFTLQLMIACEPGSLRSARARSGEHGSLYALPFALKGRPCYRVCWGLYPGKEEARDAAASLPPGILASGLKPVLLSIDRLRRQAP